MRPDPGRTIQERVIASTSMAGRVEAVAMLRRRGRRMVWQQADAAGPMSELDRAMFILDRLYPQWAPGHRNAIRARLAEAWEAGSWHGFDREP